jgi:hypothetical protein
MVLQSTAAAAGVASAHHATAAAAAATSSPAASKAAKQLLALQIEAQEKAVKLMKKLAAQNDPAKRALLQMKLEKLMSKAAIQPAAAAANSGASSFQTAAAAAGAASAALAVRKQRPQPLAGITSVLANTPAEQVRR